MKWLTLEMIKQQVRIEPDYTEEDTLLTDIGESAEETCLEYCNRTCGDIIDQYGAVPKNIVRASLLLCTIGYEQRSGVSMQNLSIVPYGNFDLLLKPYEVLAGSKDGGDEYQEVVEGSDAKIKFTADLPDGLKLSDIDFTVKVVNYCQKDVAKNYQKADCISVDDGTSYVVLADTSELGIGIYMLRLTVHIPDTDYPGGTRKEVIKINPQIKVLG